MTNEELIYSLRYCFEKRKTVVGVPWYVWCDRAADAIERLQKQNEELQAENATYRKLILLSAGEINELRYNLHLDEMDIGEIKLP